MNPFPSVVHGLEAPVYALPLDVFRVLAGVVVLAYFARIFHDTEDFSSPDGLIDHELCRRVFPPTRLSLFRPGISAGVLRVVFAVACGLALLIIVGWHARIAAGILFVVAVSTYRWNLFAVYVDDAIMHLTLFWLALLPVGSTLSPFAGAGAPAAWPTATVPGGVVRMLLANMALVYVAAGLYKFTSPMWRNGTALHAILKMPIARAPHLIQPEHAPLLRAANYWALIFEPLFALVFFLPPNALWKWLLALGAAAFHVGIVLTLKIPFANLAMLGVLPLAMGPEWMHIAFGVPLRPSAPVASPTLPTLVGAGVVTALTLMVLWEVVRSWSLNHLPLWKTHMSGFLGNPMCVLLWLVGIAQSYRLFDWIDTRNHHVAYEVLVWPQGTDEPRRVDPDAMFPTSLRHLLLQSYLIGNVWLQIPPEQARELRRSLLLRHARRFLGRHPRIRAVDVHAVTQRVTSDNLELKRGRRRLLGRVRREEGGDLTLVVPEGGD